MNRIECDNCNKDLTETGNCEAYRLNLSVEKIPCHDKGFVTMLGVSKPLNRDHHFCGVSCLKAWMEKRKQG